MNNTCNDDVFGEMTYRRAWFSSMEITWNKNIYPFKVKAKANTEQTVSVFQKNAFSLFKQDQAQYLSKCATALLRYCQEVYDNNLDESSLLKAVRPVTIIFAQEKYWGILFKCKWEDEINLAVKFTGDNLEAGVDDILL